MSDIPQTKSVTTIPASVHTKAESQGEIPWEVWHEVIQTVRDTLLTRSREEGRTSLTVAPAAEIVAELYPWISDEPNPDASRAEGQGSDRYRAAMGALTYGVGARFWDMNFYELDGETRLPLDEISRVLRENDRERLTQILVRWDIDPKAEIAPPIEKKVARVIAPDEPKES